MITDPKCDPAVTFLVSNVLSIFIHNDNYHVWMILKRLFAVVPVVFLFMEMSPRFVLIMLWGGVTISELR